jgi:hypothetical protein
VAIINTAVPPWKLSSAVFEGKRPIMLMCPTSVADLRKLLPSQRIFVMFVNNRMVPDSAAECVADSWSSLMAMEDDASVSDSALIQLLGVFDSDQILNCPRGRAEASDVGTQHSRNRKTTRIARDVPLGFQHTSSYFLVLVLVLVALHCRPFCNTHTHSSNH